jgi:ATP-binding cassette subfamily F protein uup
VLARIDRQLERIHGREAELNAAIIEAGQDYEKLTELSAELDVLSAEREVLEHEWLEAAEVLE